MDLLAWIAERRIREAMARGEFQGLLGEGKPIALEESTDPAMPEALRVAYRVLKHGGFVPPEVQLRREIYSLAELLACVDEETARGLAPHLHKALAMLQSKQQRMENDPLLSSPIVWRALQRMREIESIERSAKTDHRHRQRKGKKAKNRP